MYSYDTALPILIWNVACCCFPLPELCKLKPALYERGKSGLTGPVFTYEDVKL